MAKFAANYILDMGYQFNLVSINVVLAPNSPATAFDPESILPSSYLALVKTSIFSCKLCGVNPRKIEVQAGSGHIIYIDMPLPFARIEARQVVSDLKSNNTISSVKTIGERVQAFTYRELVWQ